MNGFSWSGLVCLHLICSSTMWWPSWGGMGVSWQILWWAELTPFVWNSELMLDFRVYFSSIQNFGFSMNNKVWFKITWINLEKPVGTGDAKDVICRAVRRMKADTLVLGCHGYGIFTWWFIINNYVYILTQERPKWKADITNVANFRALLGSVSDYCTKNAKCPAVVVKRPEK